MAVVMLDLKDYVVTDTGEVIVKYNHLVLDRLLMGKPIDGLKTFQFSYAESIVKTNFREQATRPLSDIDQHNRICEPERVIKTIELSGTPEGPPLESFEYNLPDEYLELDLVEYLAQRLVEEFPELPEVYGDRLMLEYQMMCERQMEDWLRALIYMVDTFNQHGVIYGVGRGSACASLILYLIGIHMIDPIEYDIPITEFLR